MPKKNGFIATSLIYSFFLVFIALTAALLTAFINNNTMLERFNEEAARKLDTKTYKVIIYASDAARSDKGATTLINQIGGVYWPNTTDTLQNEYEVNANNSVTIKLDNDLNKILGVTEYFSYESTNPNFNIRIMNRGNDVTPQNSAVIKHSLENGWYRYAFNFSGNDGTTSDTITIESTPESTSQTYEYRNFIMFDKQNSFGVNCQNSWLVDKIEYFQKRVEIAMVFDVEKYSTINMKYKPFTSNNAKISPCKNAAVSSEKIQDGETIVTIRNIEGDVICKIDW